MSLQPCCIFQRGSAPIVAAAIHEGHDTRPTLDDHFALTEEQRLREEDPCTAEWTQVAKTQVVALRSRFEVDLNRPRDKAVYVTPGDAWGNEIWKEPLAQQEIEESLAEYDQFYRAVENLLDEMVAEHRRVVVYDLHTYNYRRDGAYAPPADPVGNPDVNVGTGSMERDYWGNVVDRFIGELRGYDFAGRRLDVRENVRFYGGHFCRWIHEKYPRQVCALAIEFKKFFMDEWSGRANADDVERIYMALQTTLPGVQEELERM